MSITHSSAERVRRLRHRRKIGAAVLTAVEISDEIGLIELLVRSGLLVDGDRDDRAAVSKATGKLIDVVVREATWEDLA